MGRDLHKLQPWLRPYVEYAVQLHQLYTGGRQTPDGLVYGGTVPTLTSTYRSCEEQRALRDEYERGLATGRPTKWPANQPGDSAHQYGLAFDSWVPDAQMPLWVAIRRSLGFTVPENDIIHAEYPNWRAVVPERACRPGVLGRLFGG